MRRPLLLLPLLVTSPAFGQAVPPPGQPVTDSYDAPFTGEKAMTLDVAYPAGRSLKAVCTAAGNVSVTYVDGTNGVWSVVAGTQTFPIAVTAVNSSGTTATCAYSELH